MNEHKIKYLIFNYRIKNSAFYGTYEVYGSIVDNGERPHRYIRIVIGKDITWYELGPVGDCVKISRKLSKYLESHRSESFVNAYDRELLIENNR